MATAKVELSSAISL